jgi:hypothetical protein
MVELIFCHNNFFEVITSFYDRKGFARLMPSVWLKTKRHRTRFQFSLSGNEAAFTVNRTFHHYILNLILS